PPLKGVAKSQGDSLEIDAEGTAQREAGRQRQHEEDGQDAELAVRREGEGAWRGVEADLGERAVFRQYALAGVQHRVPTPREQGADLAIRAADRPRLVDALAPRDQGEPVIARFVR